MWNWGWGDTDSDRKSEPRDSGESEETKGAEERRPGHSKEAWGKRGREMGESPPLRYSLQNGRGSEDQEIYISRSHQWKEDSW